MLEAVGAEGYERTSVRTVLDRTGVYRQAFYDNFADKDDCYLQAYDAAWSGSKRWSRGGGGRGEPGQDSCGPGSGRCSTSSTPSRTSAGRCWSRSMPPGRRRWPSAPP